MVEEIIIFYDREKNKKVRDVIKFEPIMAGELTKKPLFFFNNIDFEMGIGIQLVGEGIDVNKTITSLKPGELKEVIFEFDPKIKNLNRLELSLN